MASNFTESLAEALGSLIITSDPQALRFAKTTIDIHLMKVSRALGHARFRVHSHVPDDCRACADVQAMIDDLKVR
jgi:hypothetical protein